MPTKAISDSQQHTEQSRHSPGTESAQTNENKLERTVKECERQGRTHTFGTNARQSAIKQTRVHRCIHSYTMQDTPELTNPTQAETNQHKPRKIVEYCDCPIQSKTNKKTNTKKNTRTDRDTPREAEIDCNRPKQTATNYKERSEATHTEQP